MDSCTTDSRVILPMDVHILSFSLHFKVRLREPSKNSSLHDRHNSQYSPAVTSTSLLINSHSNLTIMGFISDLSVSHESNLGGYESHLRCYGFHLGGHEFLKVWLWLKIGLDQKGPIREGLGDSHVTVGRHVRGITDREELIRIVPNHAESHFTSAS